MNLLLWLWRVLAIPTSIAVLVGIVLVMVATPINVPTLLILYGAAYLLSLSTAVRAMHRKYIYRIGRRVLMCFLAALIIIITPVTLVISVFGRIFRLFNYNAYYQAYDENDPAEQKKLAKQDARDRAKDLRASEKKEIKALAGEIREKRKQDKEAKKMASAENAKAEKKAKRAEKKPSLSELRRAELDSHVAEKIRASLHGTSSNRAVNRILDENYKGDIKIDDGTDPKVYKQVALINLSHQRYALLAEKDETGRVSGSAQAFAIVPDNKHGNTLVLVEDEDLKSRIFSVYRALLAEKRIYS